MNVIHHRRTMEKKSTYEMDSDSELTIPTDWSNKSFNLDFSTIVSHSITDLPKKTTTQFRFLDLTNRPAW